MAKVSAKIGFTLRINKNSQYEFVRPEIEISDIESITNVTEQLDEAEKALKETWERVTDIASEEILAHMGDLDQELQLQLKKKFKKIDDAIEALKQEIQRKAEKK